jgi:hypothetical protein
MGAPPPRHAPVTLGDNMTLLLSVHDVMMEPHHRLFEFLQEDMAFGPSAQSSSEADQASDPNND